MTTCITDACENEAIFTATCALCSIGKKPGPGELARSSKAKALAKVNVALPTAKFIGSLNPTDQQKKAAEKIAGNPSSHDGSKTDVGTLKLHHITTPRANFSIWFIRSVSGHHIDVYGIGKHKGKTNTVYDVILHDGTEKTVRL